MDLIFLYLKFCVIKNDLKMYILRVIFESRTIETTLDIVTIKQSFPICGLKIQVFRCTNHWKIKYTLHNVF